MNTDINISAIGAMFPSESSYMTFMDIVKDIFKVECLRHSALEGKMIKKVAICGGAGAFLLRDAIRAKADCFICGEFHYHDYFENKGVLLAELGHYQSEQYTCELIYEILQKGCPDLDCVITEINTNQTRYR